MKKEATILDQLFNKITEHDKAFLGILSDMNEGQHKVNQRVAEAFESLAHGQEKVNTVFATRIAEINKKLFLLSEEVDKKLGGQNERETRNVRSKKRR